MTWEGEGGQVAGMSGQVGSGVEVKGLLESSCGLTALSWGGLRAEAGGGLGKNWGSLGKSRPAPGMKRKRGPQIDAQSMGGLSLVCKGGVWTRSAALRALRTQA